MERARDPLRLSSWLSEKRGQGELGFPLGGDLSVANTRPLKVNRAVAGATVQHELQAGETQGHWVPPGYSNTAELSLNKEMVWLTEPAASGSWGQGDSEGAETQCWQGDSQTVGWEYYNLSPSQGQALTQWGAWNGTQSRHPCLSSFFLETLQASA